jgi:CubicO group peptidase (beta-lactamase class C family)
VFLWRHWRDTEQPVRIADWKPERDGKTITLLDLATQSSGLPRMPTSFKPANSGNPCAHYTPELLYQFLSQHKLSREAGARFEYSNLGMGRSAPH